MAENTKQQIKLIARDGTLYLPWAQWEGDEENVSILLYRYPSTDVDTCSWPLDSDEARYRLAAALYDARECCDEFEVDAEVLLPNGERFDYDAVVGEPAATAMYRQHRENARW